MPPRAAVLVPYRPDHGHRDELWAWLRPWWEDTVELEVVEGLHLDGPFNRSAAINTAARRAGDVDVFVIIDGDVILDPRNIEAAIAVAHATGGPVLGYTERHHLTEGGTRRIIKGFAGDWLPLVARTYRDSCSSMYVVTRQLFEDAGGFDELFVGWGWEDVAFRVATELVADRPLVHIGGPLWHLWHVVSSGNNRAEPTFQANKARGARYSDARHAWDRETAKVLIAEHLAARP